MWCLIKSQAKQCKIKVELVGNSYTRLAGEITGPPDTPFEGMLIDNGIFKKTRIINIKVQSLQYQWSEQRHFPWLGSWENILLQYCQSAFLE